MNVQINSSWQQVLQQQFEQPYFTEIVSFLKTEKAAGKIIYPPGSQIFNAFNLTPFNEVKLVILGQDPYHGKGQAHGLSFSVPTGIKPPPSLANIFKELQTDIGLTIPAYEGNLTSWAQQGVLLLNSALTVRDAEPASHANLGWSIFTDAVIEALSFHKQQLVFLLWGKYAQQKTKLINSDKHLILQAPHPSPFSVHTGFLGCKHFSKANNWLVQNGIAPIDWSIKQTI